MGHHRGRAPAMSAGALLRSHKRLSQPPIKLRPSNNMPDSALLVVAILMVSTWPAK
ncbi:hypothetical protein REMIM1_PA00014 (plasmid) [Rhizobium etli bv. mimosae str. Mim1]|nr:hypothetical protein REMIM1_PA00014 [Rhizobium etli bv. mimosae str. Mim1]